MEKLMSEYYYGARDQVYDTWDESYLKHYAKKMGLIKKDPVEAKRDECVESLELVTFPPADDSWRTACYSCSGKTIIRLTIPFGILGAMPSSALGWSSTLEFCRVFERSS